MTITCVGAPMGGRQLADIAVTTAEHLAADGNHVLLVEAYPPNSNAATMLGVDRLTVRDGGPNGFVHLTGPSGVDLLTPPRPLWPELRDVDTWDGVVDWATDRYDHVLVCLPVLEADTDSTRMLRGVADRLVLVLSTPAQRHDLGDLLYARDHDDGRLVCVALSDVARNTTFVAGLAADPAVTIDVVWPATDPAGPRKALTPLAKPLRLRPGIQKPGRASRPQQRRAQAARQVADLLDGTAT